jgi:hypothetical protein
LSKNKSFENQGWDQKSQMAIAFFGKDQVSDCNKINVELQNLSYTVKKTVTA